MTEEIKDAEVSPLPKEERLLLSFADALQEAISGKRIQREAWPEEEYGFFKGDFLAIHREGKDFDSWRISKGDVCENDWISF